jgi:hypothetical protein
MDSIALWWTRPEVREPALYALDDSRPIHADESLGHLAAIAVFYADEENLLRSVNVCHVFVPVPIQGTIIDTCCRYFS